MNRNLLFHHALFDDITPTRSQTNNKLNSTEINIALLLQAELDLQLKLRYSMAYMVDTVRRYNTWLYKLKF